jgi:hypothetical protein
VSKDKAAPPLTRISAFRAELELSIAAEFIRWKASNDRSCARCA